MKMIAIILAAASLNIYAMSPSDIIRDTSENAEFMMVAHRADWRSAPENSLPAIYSSIEKGATVIELDLRKTLDGHIVIMHDSTITRTTNGSGSVSSMTLEEIKQYNLLEKQGGETPVTQYKVPTLQEVIEAIDGRALINLDKAWEIREDIYQILQENEAVDIGLFKSSDDPETIQKFLDQDERILYMHILKESNVGDIEAFDRHTPVAYEIMFTHRSQPHIQPELLKNLSNDSRIWVNSLWYGLAANYTDETSHLTPESGWGILMNDMYVSMIQTDNIDELSSYINNEPKKDNTRDILVIADEFDTKGPGISYYDSTNDNVGGASRVYDSVDVCDTNGSIHLCWVSQGEWINYTIEVPKNGYYDVSARVSARQQSAGAFFLEFENQNHLHHEVNNTSNHSLFFLQEIGEIYLRKGIQTMTFRVDDSSSNINFNLNYFLLEKSSSVSK
ncbi:glycerophosphodiester phosphodiesterase family protein [Psychromonas ossibalaenae]|uniref:glycerophosphodiester phosphodiesterase family protein n=1 Tax=Psychromonas ossibalaenae TaxID=444922 RepID=UPI00036CF50B|nr:glycerophosphodiester phosphodiesterase family protein [Psychromonas ossibalaenae]